MTLGQPDIKTQVQESVQRAISGELNRLAGRISPDTQATTVGLDRAAWLPILTSLPVLIFGGGLLWWLAQPKKRSRR